MFTPGLNQPSVKSYPMQRLGQDPYRKGLAQFETGLHRLSRVCRARCQGILKRLYAKHHHRPARIDVPEGRCFIGNPVESPVNVR